MVYEYKFSETKARSNENTLGLWVGVTVCHASGTLKKMRIIYWHAQENDPPPLKISMEWPSYSGHA